jgi:hypothetical protein
MQVVVLAAAFGLATMDSRKALAWVRLVLLFARLIVPVLPIASWLIQASGIHFHILIADNLGENYEKIPIEKKIGKGGNSLPVQVS